MSPQPALELLDSHGSAFRNTARRCSLCAADADDAYQRAVEILLTKAPPVGRARLAAWMHVVVRHEAFAVRRSRERLLDESAVAGEAESALDRVPSRAPDPSERAELRERFVATARALATLTSDQRLAIVLKACGYSYLEIAAAHGWTYTKVNRCLAEGRARLRELTSVA